MSKFLSYLRCLIPPGSKATAKQVFAWRSGVAATAVVALLGVGVVFGAFERIKILGFARAEEIDDKIEMALVPVNARLLSIETSQTTQGLYLTRLVKSDIAQDIYAEKAAWCRTDDDHEKQRLREKLDLLQQEYKDLAGMRCTEPDCA